MIEGKMKFVNKNNISSIRGGGEIRPYQDL